MTPLALLTVSALAALPLGTAGWLVRRVRHQRDVSLVLALVLGAGGAAMGLLALWIERSLFGWAEASVDVAPARIEASVAALLVFVTPLEEAAKLLVVWPAVVARRIDGPGLGVTLAVCAAAGFAAVDAGAYALSAPGAVGGIRAAAGVPAHLFASGLWGYALGRRGAGRWATPIAWGAAAVIHALYDHIVFGRGPGLLIVAVPMLAAMALLGWSALEDIAPSAAPAGPRLLPSLPEPPSLAALRAALRRKDDPLAVRWVVVGALVNVGAGILGLALAVFAAHQLGVDLSVADETDMRSTGPLVLLGLGVLAAFPAAGYLVARASGSQSILEPALAAALALGGGAAVISVTAPVVLLLALAIAPVALALACGGAWLGR